MAILVEEGLMPNGTDLVMGEHRFNPNAQIKAKGQEVIHVRDLGDGFGLVGASIETALDDARENLCFLLVVTAGKMSPLVGLQAIPTVIGELGRIPVEALKASITAAIDGPKESEVSQ